MRWIALQVCSIEPLVESLADSPAATDGATLKAVSFVEAQQVVCAVALSFTPRVAVCGSAVVLEVSGSLRLFGGLHKLAALLEARLQEFFKTNSLVANVSLTQAATSLIAIGRLSLKLAGQSVPARVADMPMRSLAATHPHLSVLERTGCRTWGDLLRLPRDGVARRFGADLLAALDQARGALPEAYVWCTLPERFEQKIELDALVTQAPALMAGVRLLLVQLHAWLLGRQSGLCALQLVWHLDKRRDGAPTGELTVRTAQPAQDLTHVARLITERLNQVNLGAPVHSISLLSLQTVSLHNAAAATASLLMEPQQQGASSTQLMERLSARLGPASVQLWQPQADHRPEAMQRWVPLSGNDDQRSNTMKSIATSQSKTMAIGLKGTKTIKNDQKPSLYAAGQADTKLKSKPTTKADALYPTWLLPQPLKLTSRGGAPLYQGPLVKLAGPQRLEATGWLVAKRSDGSEPANIAPALRDYFIYRTGQGVLLWIYSERLTVANPSANPSAPQRDWRDWYLQGVFA